jgi:hypothetical protein
MPRMRQSGGSPAARSRANLLVVLEALARVDVLAALVTDPNLGAGNHTFGLACNDGARDIVYDTTYLSAVVLGPG